MRRDLDCAQTSSFISVRQDAFVTNKWKEYATDITDVPDYEFIVKRFQLRPDEKTDVSASTSIVKQNSLEGDTALAPAPRFASLSHSKGVSYS